jgi:hypothetical protein
MSTVKAVQKKQKQKTKTTEKRVNNEIIQKQ